MVLFKKTLREIFLLLGYRVLADNSRSQGWAFNWGFITIQCFRFMVFIDWMFISFTFALIMFFYSFFSLQLFSFSASQYFFTLLTLIVKNF